MERYKYILDESAIPTHWYNVQADLPQPLLPPIDPATKMPVDLAKMTAIFPAECVAQEVSSERWIEIPDEVRDKLAIWRPTPLHRARRLEKVLDTPARIYYKYEGVSPAGSHKLNTAVAQAYYLKKEGGTRCTTETGAGQWGSSMAMAAKLFGLACQVYMVRISYDQKPYRRILMETWGAKVDASPSPLTAAGRAILAKDPDTPGSLSMAIAEGMEDALNTKGSKYLLGSLLNHVIMHQTVIGQEARKQMEMAGDYPDIIIGCCAGGSSFGGLAFPFLRDRLVNGAKTRFMPVEPTACPSLTRGEFRYDYGDSNKLTPLIPMHTLGHTFIPAKIHAGGLRHHGMGPLISHLYNLGHMEPRAYNQMKVFESARLFAQCEGFIPAPESAHGLRAAIDEALRCKAAGRAEVILFNMSGHGLFDLSAYDEFNNGRMQPYDLPEEEIRRTLKDIESQPRTEEIAAALAGMSK
ncbi:MAG: TrpB-like pyridoxal phosphate-dependent enzyme [Candidatus Tectomicrobia bacterium]|nr:TrpB-like pyridoxal phosphate-dependent enzyme [Candidatus Tectomicrobia bacterium]